MSYQRVYIVNFIKIIIGCNFFNYKDVLLPLLILVYEALFFKKLNKYFFYSFLDELINKYFNLQSTYIDLNLEILMFDSYNSH